MMLLKVKVITRLWILV